MVTFVTVSSLETAYQSNNLSSILSRLEIIINKNFPIFRCRKSRKGHFLQSSSCVKIDEQNNSLNLGCCKALFRKQIYNKPFVSSLPVRTYIFTEGQSEPGMLQSFISLPARTYLLVLLTYFFYFLQSLLSVILSQLLSP